MRSGPYEIGTDPVDSGENFTLCRESCVITNVITVKRPRPFNEFLGHLASVIRTKEDAI